MKALPVSTREKATPIPEQDRLLVTEPVAAQLLNLSLKTFRKLVKLGLISPVALPGGKDGGRLRRNLYRKSDLEVLAFGRSAKS